jgi:hypothetical protein
MDTWYELKPVRSVTDLRLIVISDEDLWTAQPFTFTSPVSQHTSHKILDLKSGTRPMLRIEPTGPKEPIMVVAARTAFGKIEQALVKKMLELRGVECSPGAKCFDLVWALSHDLLPELSEAELVAIMQQRAFKVVVEQSQFLTRDVALRLSGATNVYLLPDYVLKCQDFGLGWGSLNRSLFGSVVGRGEGHLLFTLSLLIIL